MLGTTRNKQVCHYVDFRYSIIFKEDILQALYNAIQLAYDTYHNDTINLLRSI